MRIAFISCEYPPAKGGIGTYVSQVAKALAAIGWDVHVFAGSMQGIISTFTEGFQVHRVECENGEDFKYKVVSVFGTQHLLQPFDLIESPEINGNAWEIKKQYPGIPLVVRLHAPSHLVEKFQKKYIPFFAKLRFVAGALRRLRFDAGYWRSYNKLIDPDYHFIQLANYISAPSDVMKEWVVKHWQIPANNITVIPNIFSPPVAFLEIPIVREMIYRQVVFFGRLNVLKGMVNATYAMKKILSEHPGWRFKIIGDNEGGPDNKITMREWMKLQFKKVADRVEFIDGVPYEGLPAAIKKCEIVLLPSLFESFSYTCAEAMAAGKAIVGSNNGGMADLLQNDKSGLLINPDNATEIYAAIHKIITENDYRYQLSVRARERILKDFDAGKITLRYAAFYEKIPAKVFSKN